MTPHLDAVHLRFHRMRVQGLWRRRLASPREVVGRLCGIQAQEPAAASLAVRIRGTGFPAAALERARGERTVVRTWCLRGTLHLVDRDDLDWMLPLLGPVLIARSRRRREQLGLDDPVLGRARKVLREALTEEDAMTRDQIGARLARNGVRLEGQALYHAIRHLALEGVLCHGPGRDGQESYVLLRPGGRATEGVSGAPDRDEALQWLARRYLAGHGPATLDDLARWSGLGKRDARKGWAGIAEETVEVRVGGGVARILSDQAAWLDDGVDRRELPVVRLLPAYDPYLLGYAGRGFAVAAEHARRIHPGGGVIRPALIVDGRVAGSWKGDVCDEGSELRVEPFAPLGPAAREALTEEIEELCAASPGP